MMSQTVGDDLEVMTGALKEAANQAELVITTGGVSVGQKDLTEEALLSIGAKILFHGIAMKPGMPTLAAEKDGVLFIGFLAIHFLQQFHLKCLYVRSCH